MKYKRLHLFTKTPNKCRSHNNLLSLQIKGLILNWNNCKKMTVTNYPDNTKQNIQEILTINFKNSRLIMINSQSIKS